MATSIRLDAVTDSDADGSGSLTEPFNHTTADQPDRVMLVAVAHDQDTTGTVADVTYNSVSLTQIDYLDIATSRLWVGYLKDPATGTNSVNVAWGPGTPTIGRITALTFYNTNPTTPVGQTISKTSENTIPTNFSETINPDGSRGMIVDFYFGSRGIAGNAKTPQTEVTNITGNWSGGVSYILGSSYVAHSGANTTMEWENLTHDSSAADQFLILVELREKIVADGLAHAII